MKCKAGGVRSLISGKREMADVYKRQGVKLGLANIITVYAVYHYRPAEVMMIVFVRVFLGALFGGVMSLSLIHI